MPLLWIVVAQILAVLSAVVVARLVFVEINVISIGFSSILIGVGMDYCILVYHFFAQAGELDPHEWRELRHAIWLSSVTTAATFGILFFSSFPGLRQLAVLVAVGLIAMAFFATTFLARLLSRRRPQAPRWLLPASARCARFLSRHRLAFRICAAAIVGTVLVFGRPLSQFGYYDPSVEQLEPSELEPFQAQKLLQAQAPQIPAEDFTGGDMGANRRAWQPVDVAALKAEFDQAGFDATWSTATAQVVEALNRWQAGGLDLAGPTRISDTWAQLRTDLNRVAVSDFKRLSLVMSAIVLGLCFVAHRKVRLVALNFAALVLALLLFALMLYVTDTSMTLLSLLCIPLMIGLVIDYSLHILLALEHAHGDLVEAARHLAVPVLLTGIASLIGFAAPMFSSQPSLQNFGNVMDLGTVAAVISGLILLPALYGRLKKP
jgi:predicted exporter